ncbi:iron ABC transporter permease [Acidaminococcus timonensis]|jgi:iron(III) transport system permease protein|uniref:ABC transporter permease n=1 Tax=Acidaminococcus TaxID=904 RepID=UPI0026EE3835|nr:iron ABC transporter permease [Acidaminococcus timonensis]
MKNGWQWLPALGLGVFLLLLIGAPLADVFVKAVIIDDRLDFSYALATLAEPGNGQMIANSLLLGALVVVLSTCFAVPVAYLLSRTELARKHWLDILFLVPFMTPPYIASMGWILFMQKRGLFAQLFPAFPDGIPAFFSLGGLVLVMSLHIFPFLMVLLKNAMLRIPPSLEEAGAMVGAGPGLRLRKIFLPLLTGNYAIGALLVFVKTISEYGTPYTLGRRIGFDVFTTHIHRYAAIAPISFGKAAVLASVLVGICLVLWLVQNLITWRHTYALVGGKGQRQAFRKLSALERTGAWGLLLGIFFLAVGIPYFSVLTTSVIKLRGYGLAAGNFTLHHYQELLSTSDGALEAIGNSFAVAGIAATLCALLGTLVVLAVRSLPLRQGKILEGLSLLPEMLPGIVLVIGLMLFWNDIYDLLPLYNTRGILVVAYTALFLPYTVQYVTSAFSQINPNLLAAGRVFGGSRLYIFRRITCPLLLRGIGAGWMMTFIISARELVAPSLIAPPDTLVISTFIMREFEQGSVSLGMCMAVLCILLTTGTLLVLRGAGNKKEL